MTISNMSTSPSGHSSNSSNSYEVYQSSRHGSHDGDKLPSSRGSTSTDYEHRSPVPTTPVMSREEIESLKVYSYSVQHLTYQLFKNLHPDLSTDGKLSFNNIQPGNIMNIAKKLNENSNSTSTNPNAPNQQQQQQQPIGFHSSELVIDNCITKSNSLTVPSSKKRVSPEIAQEDSFLCLSPDSNYDSIEQKSGSVRKSLRHFSRRKRRSGGFVFPDHTGL